MVHIGEGMQEGHALIVTLCHGARRGAINRPPRLRFPAAVAVLAVALDVMRVIGLRRP